MSHHVPTCAPDDTVANVIVKMTTTRYRHLPVVENGELAGLVSIGDVVRHRLEEIELETNVLRDLYHTRH
jgi:CBS domain-containing protein